MKHLLSIITLLGIVSLIFVSCTKSPEQYVENCADARFIDSREAFLASVEQNNDGSSIASNMLKEDISFVKSKSLQKKLQREYMWLKLTAEFSYEYFFKSCSQEMTKDEVYFKAKWK
tara:strand:- start:50 stop:400 length:351 start_codon:yes stop_codon:yes gene_type:complete